VIFVVRDSRELVKEAGTLSNDCRDEGSSTHWQKWKQKYLLSYTTTNVDKTETNNVKSSLRTLRTKFEPFFKLLLDDFLSTKPWKFWNSPSPTAPQGDMPCPNG